MRWPWIESGYLQIADGDGSTGIPLSLVFSVAIVVFLPITVLVLVAVMSSKRRERNH